MLDAGRVLRGEHDRVDRLGLAVGIADGDLRLGVGAQPAESSVLAQLRLALDQAVREEDGQRHVARRLVAGVAEHEALVARALLEVQALALVHALRDVGRLLAVGDQDGAGRAVEAERRVGIADALDGVARDLVVLHARVGGDLARQHHQVVLHQRLGGDARGLVLL